MDTTAERGRMLLTGENIDRASMETAGFLARRRTAQRDIARVRLGLEEVLLTYREAFGEDTAFSVDRGGFLGRSRVRLNVAGAPLDPFTNPEYSTDEDEFMRLALSRLGLRPQWRFRKGANQVLFTARRRSMPELSRILTAIALAVVLGLIVRHLPGQISVTLQEGIFAPLLDTFLGFLNAVAGPMIFLSVVWGIYSIGDAATFSAMGKRLGARIGLCLCVCTPVTAALLMPLFSLRFGAAQAGGDFSALYRMVLDIIPTNLFTPFSRGNTLQILFVAIAVGVAMLLVGKDTQGVAALSEQLGFIVNGIMDFVSRLVPAFVFGSLFSIIVTSRFETLAAGGRFFLSTVLGCLVLLVLHTAAVCLQLKISPLTLWRKTSSTFIISITTASSSAAFSDNLRTCIDDLAVPPRLANFGVPFGQILYKPSVAVMVWFAAVSAAEAAGVTVSLTWVVTALVMSIVLSVAVPPVPGGETAVFTIVFSQLNLPVTDLAVILSLSTVLDFLLTATDLFCVQCLLASLAQPPQKP